MADIKHISNTFDKAIDTDIVVYVTEHGLTISESILLQILRELKKRV